MKCCPEPRKVRLACSTRNWFISWCIFAFRSPVSSCMADLIPLLTWYARYVLRYIVPKLGWTYDFVAHNDKSILLWQRYDHYTNAASNLGRRIELQYLMSQGYFIVTLFASMDGRPFQNLNFYSDQLAELDWGSFWSLEAVSFLWGLKFFF